MITLSLTYAQARQILKTLESHLSEFEVGDLGDAESMAWENYMRTLIEFIAVQLGLARKSEDDDGEPSREAARSCAIYNTAVDYAINEELRELE